jgi:ElaB/YqjD/DUF883 family membrane-anchored ribosome-binding protein
MTPDSTTRIRSDIERTREDMSETIDEIQERLSPATLAAQAKEAVKEQTVGRVKEAARGVSESASNTAEGIREGVRQNPWPAIMIGAGTAWMLFDGIRRGANGPRSYGQYRGSARMYGRPGGEEYFEHGDGTTGYYDTAEGSDVNTSGAAYDSGYRGYASGSRGAYGTGYADYAQQRGARAMQKVSQTSSQLRDLMSRNPLVVGAVAAAVGVAVGLALPETERENQLMGETRDNLVERAQDMAQGAVAKAKEVAVDATSKVAGDAARQVVGSTESR